MIKNILGAIALALGSMAGQGPYIPNPNVTRLPSYLFQPGQVLTYQGQSSQAKGAGTAGADLATTIWVTGQNPDGSWHMVVRRARAAFAVDPAGTRTDEPARAVWAVWDLSPAGRAIHNRTMEELDPNALFLPLPENILVANAGWKPTRHNHWEQDKYVLDSRSNDSIWIVNDTFQDPLVQVGRMKLAAEVRIDVRQGLPARRDEIFIQYIAGSPRETRTVTTLASVRFQDTVWLKALASDARDYFKTDSVYEACLERAVREPKKTGDLLALARIALERCRSRSGTAEFQDQLDAELAGFGQDSAYVQDQAALLAGFIGRPARSWQTEDFDGKPYRLQDLRTNVIIMDFWYRGCPWCIMSMPQLKQLAGHFAGRPLIVLGMNRDQNEADARTVIEQMKLTYPNLKAAAITDDYGIKIYPFLLVVDQKGVIRDAHIGYSPGLFDALRARVEELLK